MNYDTVYKAIEDQITGITGLPFLAKENSGYKPTLLTPWMRATMLPGEPTQVTQGVSRLLRFNGLIQVDVFTPANSGNTGTAVNALITHFNANRFLLPTGIIVNIERAWRGAGVTETDWYRVPVYLRWQTFAE